MKILNKPIIFFAAIVMAMSFAVGARAQQAGMFRVGEKLTYTVSIDSFDEAAFAEFYVVSAGKLGERDAIEIRSKFRTLNFASAAFYMVDETRTTFASPETGLPITQLLKQLDLVPSTTEANRLIEQGGVKVNGDRVSDRALKLAKGGTYVVQVGKRKFARVTLA